jgi:predicted nucleic acid-binding protein
VLDTNVVVRHLVGTPTAMASGATRVLRSAETLVLHDVVLAECIFVLSSIYEYPRAALVGAMRSLLALPSIRVQDGPRIQSALALYAQRGISFVDAYIAAVAHAGESPVASFDRGFDRIPGLRRIEP